MAYLCENSLSKILKKEYKYIKEYVIPFLIICIFMVIVIMVSTGLIAQFLERLFNKLRKENKNDRII